MEKQPQIGKPYFSLSRVDALSILFAASVTLAAIALLPQIALLKQFGYVGIFFISLLSSATVFIPLPGFAVVFAMGRVLNPFLVGLAAGLGSAIGESTGYFAGYAGHETVENSKIFQEHKKQIARGGPVAIFLLALIPNPAFDIAGIAAGAIQMPVWKFLIATAAGKALRYITLAYVGGFSAEWI
ncbi:MAG: VTT domain-containing protein [Candidatus Anstonellaceae archaeon]